ncbi:LysR family transcriptional regulator [Leeia aquatica]|uniref:LysR family transcriptional regulator n=1 Tax=Leeia aquatica TaxID=2725557 RepID=A0A847SA15_9NEIS|nr:LysR family transcriptional regulator [Leeia aquatica]NLR75715.1 LysR family transcriptional regulator [Leeia aquatica]
MNAPDYNLLHTLDVLLREGSVAGAARALHLSPSAMSRALARLRETTGDPLLVRAGRGLVPTPRALALRESVALLAQQVEMTLRPERPLVLAQLQRSFTLRCREGFVEAVGPALLAHLATQAPGVRLNFMLKVDRNSAALRDGSVDLDTGVVGEDIAPELRVQSLFRDRFVVAVRAGHPLLAQPLTTERYAAASHVVVTRGQQLHGQVDSALAQYGLQRQHHTVVSSFATALALARRTDLVATVPERHSLSLSEGMQMLPLPFELPAFTVSLLWHPRLEADPAHRWLRQAVREVCLTAFPQDSALSASVIKAT